MLEYIASYTKTIIILNFINNYYNYQILYLDKNKNHIMLNFLLYCTGYQLVK